jgi:UDP-N-acetylmuramate dehydrogenase
MTSAVDAAEQRLGSRARRHVPLGPLTTYRVGGAAALAVTCEGPEDLELVAATVAATGVDVVVVGRGSNMLVADEGFSGLAVMLGSFADTCVIDGARVHAGASATLPGVARRSVAAGLSGFEWAVGVPGSIGGAIRMNAGGHGSDMAACVLDVEVIDLTTGDRRRRPASELEFGFRSSALGDHEVVIDATLMLEPGDPHQGEERITEIVRWRRENQPGGHNAGSVFVNPVPGSLAAGRLVDELGLRGWRHGSAEVSTKHANFIQADPDGRAADVVAVMREVRRRVHEAYGIELRSEVRLVGFGEAATEFSPGSSS